MDFLISVVGRQDFDVSHLKPRVSKDFTVIDLRIAWATTLTLSIDHKTNKFATNDMTALTGYLDRNELSLDCQCANCHSAVYTGVLNFSAQGYLRAVELAEESINVTVDKKIYHFYCNYRAGLSRFFISTGDGFTLPFSLETQLVPRSKFKNREELINKMKTYALFS